VAITDGPFRGFAALHTGVDARPGNGADRPARPQDDGRVPAGLRGRRHHEPGATHRAARRHRRARLVTWPDTVRDQVARWLTPQAAKPGNGLDPHPPPDAPTKEAKKLGAFRPVRPRSAGPTPSRRRPRSNGCSERWRITRASASSPWPTPQDAAGARQAICYVNSRREERSRRIPPADGN
jgi:hypothetical protein